MFSEISVRPTLGEALGSPGFSIRRLSWLSWGQGQLGTHLEIGNLHFAGEEIQAQGATFLAHVTPLGTSRARIKTVSSLLESPRVVHPRGSQRELGLSSHSFAFAYPAWFILGADCPGCQGL